jgi:hypothetical protein
MKAYAGADVWINVFLTSAKVGGEWSDSRPCRFTPAEGALGIHWIGGGMGPRVGLDAVEKRKSCIAGNRTTGVQPVARRYSE